MFGQSTERMTKDDVTDWIDLDEDEKQALQHVLDHALQQAYLDGKKTAELAGTSDDTHFWLSAGAVMFSLINTGVIIMQMSGYA